MYKSRGLPVILRINVQTCLVSVVGVVALSCNVISKDCIVKWRGCGTSHSLILKNTFAQRD